MKKILIVGGMKKGHGVSEYIAKTYSKLLSNNEFEFTFVSETGSVEYDEMFNSSVKIKTITPFWKNPILYVSDWIRLLSNEIDIVHFHYDKLYFKWIPVMLARMKHIKKIIVQSHNSNMDGKIILKLLNKIGKLIVNACATDFVAVSQTAGIYMFSTKNLESSKYFVIYNGIDTNKYKYSAIDRNVIRQKLMITDELVLGNVGRLQNQKNQQFLLEIIPELLKLNIKCKLVIVGEGELKEKLVEYTKDLSIEDHVVFLSYSNEIEKYYSAFDIFLFPSIYEGMPLSVIEASASGLNIVTSNMVTSEVIVNDNSIQVPLNINEWVKEISRFSNTKIDRTKNKLIDGKSNFDLKDQIVQISNLYE